MSGDLPWLRAAALALAATSAPAAAGTRLDVVVQGVRGTAGVVTASLCTREEYEADDCRLMRSAPAAAARTVVTFADAPPGRYAVVVFHDRDADGEVKRNLLGVPLEGVGFSRNPSLWRRPAFADVAFDVAPGERRAVSIKLRFEPAA